MTAKTQSKTRKTRKTTPAAAAKRNAPAGAVESGSKAVTSTIQKGAAEPTTVTEVLCAGEVEFVERWNTVLFERRDAAAESILDLCVEWAKAKNEFEIMAKENNWHTKGGAWGQLCRDQGFEKVAAVKKLVKIGRARIDGPLTGIETRLLPPSVSSLEVLTMVKDQETAKPGKKKGESVIVRKPAAEVTRELVESGAITPETPRAKVTEAVKAANGEEVKSRKPRTPSSGTESRKPGTAKPGTSTNVRREVLDGMLTLDKKAFLRTVAELMHQRGYSMDDLSPVLDEVYSASEAS